jgi:hypothetical protein
MMTSLRRWLARPRTSRPARTARYDQFFADPGTVEDDYRRLGGSGLPCGAAPWVETGPEQGTLGRTRRRAAGTRRVTLVDCEGGSSWRTDLTRRPGTP